MTSLTKACAVIAMAASLSACGPNPFVFGCAVFGSKFLPDDGFEARWTRVEKQQAVAHNKKVERYCR